MAKRIAKLVALLVLLCGAVPATAMCTPPGEPPGALLTDTCIMASDAAMTWRYLATINGDTACPAASGWSGGKLFGDGPLPPGLNDYCRYQADAETSSVAALTSMLCSGATPPANCLTALEPDLLALSPLSAQVIEDLVADGFEQQFLAQSGATGPLPAGPQKVRLAVIDTEPTGLNEDRNGPGLSGHGFALLSMVRAMVCPNAGSCGMQLKSQLGLPLELCSTAPGASCRCSSVPATGVCSNRIEGGAIGSQADLATAIRDEVKDWEGSAVDRLVINLSVGWEPRFGGSSPVAGQNIAVNTVYAALRYASCRGAIVIAAAGNRVPGPEMLTGPLYPAAWETEEAPDGQQCLALLGNAPDPTMFPVPMGSYRPLVYAAGAIDHQGSKVEVRPGGEPRMAAFADHAVMRPDFGGGTAELTAVLTGTSVGAAVVSAAAAAAWYLRPAAPGYAIMQSIYAGAGDVGRDADFCLGGDCGSFPVRRVRACEAIAAVCSTLPGPACPVYACPIDVPVLAPIPRSAILSAFVQDPVTDLSTFVSSAPVPECGANYTLHWDVGGTVPTSPCPHLQFYGVQATPWTDGQPSGQACEVCISDFASPGRLFIEIKDDFESSVEDLTLLCGDDAYRIPGVMQPGHRQLVEEIPQGCEFENVAMAFRVNRNGVDNASVLTAALQVADRDGDGVQDAIDNCYRNSNPLQIDTDGDSMGNRCDADFNGDCFVNFVDLGILKSVFFTGNANFDLSGDGIVNFSDLGLFKSLFLAPPGPSGIANTCSP